MRPELQLELRTALLRVFERDQAHPHPADPGPVQWASAPGDPFHPSHVPLWTGEGKKQEKQALIFFLEDEQDEPTVQAAQEQDETRKNALVRQLENEVRRLREQLQASIEEYESSS